MKMRDKILEICMEIDDTIDYTSTELIDGGLIDSITFVEILTEIMDTFEIEIPYSENISANYNSIDAMVKLVEKYQ